MAPAITPAYLKPKEAAAYMSLGLSTFYRLVNKKLIRLYKVEGVRLVKVSELDKMITSSQCNA
jgi:excisionase family DNA binding protein